MRGKIPFDRITTRKGDDGLSTLYTGERLPKDDLVFQTLGDIDELTSFLGWARAEEGLHPHQEHIKTLQRSLGKISSEIATPPSDPLFPSLDTLQEADILSLEEWEKELLEETEIPREFILPGDTPASARLDVCRAVCRRAERSIVALIRRYQRDELLPCQRYLNRMSDYLFILARSME
jgi:cob(I)alamin adenosyltransferase